MNGRRFGDCVKGFRFASFRFLRDEKFVLFWLAFVVLALALTFLTSELFRSAMNAPYEMHGFLERLRSLEEAALENYQMTGDAEQLSLANYYAALADSNNWPGCYYLLNGKGSFGEPQLVSSVFSNRIALLPTFLGIPIVYLTWQMLASPIAFGCRKNILPSGIGKKSFQLGICLFIILLNVCTSFVCTAFSFINSGPKLVLERTNTEWSFGTVWPTFALQSMMCVFSTVLYSLLILVLMSFSFVRLRHGLMFSIALVAPAISLVVFVKYFMDRPLVANISVWFVPFAFQTSVSPKLAHLFVYVCEVLITEICFIFRLQSMEVEKLDARG